MDFEPEVNESVAENVSNATGREAATTEGIIITYSSLFLMALLPLLFGSLRSVTYHSGLKVGGARERSYMHVVRRVASITDFCRVWGGLWHCSGPIPSLSHSPQTRGEEAGDRIAMKDAAMFPVYASGGLFGLYLFFKVHRR